MKNVIVSLLMLTSSLARCEANQHAAQTKQEPAKAEAEQKLTRKVEGRVILSDELPAARLEFAPEFKYAGGQSFILYNVARAEQHFFVDADAQGRIKRLYWVQFEGYLPDNKHTYNYRSPSTARIGDFDFFADAAARNLKAGPGRPDSDGARAQSFLQSKDHRFASDDVIMQRLVHLTDETKRNELMIIYMEDLSATGLTAADLAPSGKDAARWPEISAGLLERAKAGVKITRRG